MGVTSTKKWIFGHLSVLLVISFSHVLLFENGPELQILTPISKTETFVGLVPYLGVVKLALISCDHS